MLADREGPRVVAHLLEDLGFDLTDALARDAELLADLLERVTDTVLEAEAHLDDLALAGRQKLEHRVDVLLPELTVGRFKRIDCLFVFDEVTELAVFLGTHRRLERNDVLGNLLNMGDLLDIHLHFDSEFFERRFAAELLDQTALRVGQLVDRLDHVDRDADRAGLVGDGAGDGLTDPPRGIRAEFETAFGIEFLHRAEEADVAFLNQVEERESAADVFFGDTDNETKVGFGKLLLGSRVALADAASELDFLATIDERDATDLGEIHADGVIGNFEEIDLALLALLLTFLLAEIFIAVHRDTGGGDHAHGGIIDFIPDDLDFFVAIGFFLFIVVLLIVIGTRRDHVGEVFGRLGEFETAGTRLLVPNESIFDVDHLNAEINEQRVDLVEHVDVLFGIRNSGDNLLMRNVALLATFLNKVLNLVGKLLEIVVGRLRDEFSGM